MNFKQTLSILWTLFLLLQLSYFNPSYAVEKSKNVKVHQKREEPLTLDFVLTEAVKNSDRFKEVISKSYAIKKEEYLSKIPTDINLRSQVGRRFNSSSSRAIGRPPTNLFNSSNPYFNSMSQRKGYYYNLQTDTYFQTGTKAILSFNNNKYSDASSHESQAQFTISQSLLKDAFGYQTRKLRQAGRLTSKANEESLALDIERWALDVIDVYYRAWQLHSEVQAAQNNLSSRRRLLNITKIKLRRGTVERSDLLQVEGTLLEAQIRLNSAREGLMNIWRDLVIQLKLPESWLDYDPLQIQMSLDSTHDLQDCNIKDYPKTSTETKYWEYLRDASLLKKKSAKNAFLPDLQLTLGLSSTSREDSSTFEKPTGSIGLAFEMPLSHFKEKAELSETLANYAKASAITSFLHGQDQIQWINNCSYFKHLKNVINLRYENLKKQRERNSLDERRYRLGRMSLLEIIQSGDEAINSQLLWDQSQVDLKLNSWQMQQASGQLRQFITKIQAQLEEQQTSKARQ